MDALKKLSSSAKGQSVNELRLVLALERVVARSERHAKLSNHIVFKGGFVLLKSLEEPRFTHLALTLRWSKESLLLEKEAYEIRGTVHPFGSCRRF